MALSAGRERPNADFLTGVESTTDGLGGLAGAAPGLLAVASKGAVEGEGEAAGEGGGEAQGVWGDLVEGEPLQ